MVYFVLCLFTLEQNQKRIDICNNLKFCLGPGKNILSEILAGNETWIFGNNRKLKNESLQWKNCESSHQVIGRLKSMPIVSYNQQGNCTRRDSETTSLHRHFTLVLPIVGASGDWCFLNDNTSCHLYVKVQQFIIVTNMNICLNLSHSYKIWIEGQTFQKL